MLVIIDYGMGNIRSVEKAFERVGYRAIVAHDPQTVAQANGLVLPGVGAFGKAMDNLTKQGLVSAIISHVQSKKPFLGICLGLQILFEESEECDNVKGLQLLDGRVQRFSVKHKVPHMGWNRITVNCSGHTGITCPLLKGIPDGTYMYFVHSYYVEPREHETVLTTTEYGMNFTSMIGKGTLFATQFHPEKSQAMGLRLLKNFGKLVEQKKNQIKI